MSLHLQIFGNIQHACFTYRKWYSFSQFHACWENVTQFRFSWMWQVLVLVSTRRELDMHIAHFHPYLTFRDGFVTFLYTLSLLTYRAGYTTWCRNAHRFSLSSCWYLDIGPGFPCYLKWKWYMTSPWLHTHKDGKNK